MATAAPKRRAAKRRVAVQPASPPEDADHLKLLNDRIAGLRADLGGCFDDAAPYESAASGEPRRLKQRAFAAHREALARLHDEARRTMAACSQLRALVDRAEVQDLREKRRREDMCRPVLIEAGPHQGKWRCGLATGPDHTCSTQAQRRVEHHGPAKRSRIERHIQRVHLHRETERAGEGFRAASTTGSEAMLQATRSLVSDDGRSWVV